ncbi:hypothetical protein LTR99_005911 [Exophiala xenobiotica]|uniref:Major facilitator superfamily (MFS) profile domain-containing protein n=1 Tax=Vermiconidia calcicola TaxID=1690605 RepID=A0AAV9QFK5_9PEZI|nr:hypothetical protein H2202_000215 [Exophiala xenobiotica]KAK5541015.1 hypothetical protein LTR25_002792 [Vermiconidia calcicola]KAK5549492.1 hypothetical protein LTR23_000600 [Chaetothyriales sp. CCFEE 6169]KAK5193858.1 hypothetical protein LTR92_006198 [Exophiala xenobiotica]KAK5208114.1 hypothetical protein LTR41_006050 [Exophiala xenobiotica]
MGRDEHDGAQQSITSSPSRTVQSRSKNQTTPLPTEQINASDRTLTDDAPPPSEPPDDEVQVDRRDPKKIISFSSNDPESPYNWPRRKKLLVFITGIISVVNSTLTSSLPSNAIDFIAKDFNVTGELQLPLPISCFLAGYVVGPTVCGPLSENNGRKPVILGFFLFATIFGMACSVAPNWPALLVFRFLCGVGSSGPIAIVGGLYADIYNDPRERGQSMAWFMVATTFGPILAPAISGFIAENTSWRWVFAVGTLLAVLTIPLICIMPESYTPVLLSRKAKRLRKETGDSEIIARTDLQKKTLRHILTVVMTRPYRMLFQEVIVMCTCAYLALAYGIFYIYFQAYPIIFQGPDSVYKWSYGLAGLAFLPIGIGSIFAAPIFLWWDSYLAKAQKQKAKWAEKEEYRRLPLACLGGPLYVVSMFWIGWSANPDTFWLAPVASGITFGVAFMLIFMALLNYLTDAYETYAASAQGIASTCRSAFGVLLPLASHRMFSTLGIAWACSVLGFLSMGMCVIPFAFIWYGDKIRDNSKFCKELKEMKARETERQESEDRVQQEMEHSPGENNPETIYDKV